MNRPSERTLLTLAIFGTLIALTVGLFIFYSRYEYAEYGHKFIVIGYITACVLTFFALRFWNFVLMFIAVGLLIFTQAYAGEKFDWRQSYIEMARMGQPFFLEELIEEYPIYEEHTFSEFFRKPDWIRFNDDCIQPALLNQPVPPRCTTVDLIQRFYHIDIISSMRNHLGKMQRTAKMIEEGKMAKRSAYSDCIANKICVSIPLLPKGVDADKIQQNSSDYIGIRQSFWSLINDKKMSQQTCSLMPVCRALVTMRVIEPTKMPF